MMKRSFSVLMPAMLLIGVVGGLSGCMPSTELGGAEVPNARPDTRVTGSPPSLLEASFVVRFHWTGSDPDGKVLGFQWKLSNNGLDGISVQDTLTIDPATGDTLNPWLFTTATDTTFLVSADLSDFPEDDHLDPRDRRSYQTHTFFIRTIDEEGGVDPTPAYISFTSTTLLPRISVDRPERLSNYLDAQSAPPTVTFGYSGSDPDYDIGMPTEIRYLFKTAWLRDHYVRTKEEFDNVVERLVSFSDSAWSDWLPYPGDPEERYLRFSNQPRLDEAGDQIIYLFAIQARDVAGAVSVDRFYGRNVQNVYISNSMTPLLVMNETYLGQRTATGRNSKVTIDIAQGQQLDFSWVASADIYAGVIEAYRYGWDITDVEDEEDPRWAVLPGNSSQHRRAPITSFGIGTHTLTIQAWDNSGQLTRFVWILEVVPVPDPSVQSPVLLVDDIPDHVSLAWSSESGKPLDADRYRDEFWEDTLGGEGGVLGYDPTLDVIDTVVETFGYRDIVNYRVVILFSRWMQNNFVWDQFKPDLSGDAKFIWLGSYQESVGNLFLAGSRILNEFLEERQWMVPWVFQTSESVISYGSQGVYFVGFGTRELPDGTEVQVGRERYPYAITGISVLDQVTPKYKLFGRPSLGQRQSRASVCVGIKGLLLDEEFLSNQMPEGAAFPETILTSTIIDWKDDDPEYRATLSVWPWGSDEFYDANISERTTPWSPQMCDGEPCIEPMFRVYSRFDWVNDLHEAMGDPDWPAPYFSTDEQLEAKCGRFALNLGQMRTRTTGLITGFISHKMEANKPNRQGDVVWGFDPYRFDREDIQGAIRWVLSDYFGLTLRP